ncbi:hypothetical protein BGX31_000485 [Mortierella sp. GBA43]|nr:hypothetical protein BGX31_000485 [Mortierella sp. GBA43]
MAPVQLSTDHLLVLLASLGFHLTYFYLIKTFVPYIGKDRKRLSWVLTLTTAFIVSILGPYATFGNIRTVFSDQISSGYDILASKDSIQLESSTSNLYRYDTGFQPRPHPELTYQDPVMVTLDPKMSMWRKQKQQDEPVDHQDSLEQLPSPFLSNETPLVSSSMTEAARVSFHRMFDMSSWQSILYSRWFFDMRYAPSDSWMSQVTVIFFACYLVLDIVCGLLHYRERVSLLAGWFHHTMYTGICYYTLIKGESHTLASFLIIESFIYSRFRHDMLFGASFVVFRILWDFALTHEFIMNRPGTLTVTKIILIFKSTMNFKFFIDWVNQQIRLRNGKHVAKVAGVSDEACIKSETPETSVMAAAHATHSRIKSGIATSVYQEGQERKKEELLRQSRVLSSSTFIHSDRAAIKRWGARTRTADAMEEPRMDLIAVY